MKNKIEKIVALFKKGKEEDSQVPQNGTDSKLWLSNCHG